MDIEYIGGAATFDYYSSGSAQQAEPRHEFSKSTSSTPLQDLFDESERLIDDYKHDLTRAQNEMNGALDEELKLVRKVRQADGSKIKLLKALGFNFLILAIADGLTWGIISIFADPSLSSLIGCFIGQNIVYQGREIYKYYKGKKNLELLKAQLEEAHSNSDDKRENLTRAFNQLIECLQTLENKLVQYKDSSNYLSPDDVEEINKYIDYLVSLQKNFSREKREDLSNAHLLLEY